MKAHRTHLTYQMTYQTAFVLILLLGSKAPADAKVSAGLRVDNPPDLRSIAFKRNLEHKRETALDFYQKAVDKSIRDYGADSSYTGNLYFEMGLLALNMSKFTTAENCLRHAVASNPHSVEAHLKLAEVLKLREKPSAYRLQISQSLERNAYAPQARQQLIACLQETNPAAATRQSFYLHQIFSGLPLQTMTPHNAQTTQPEETKPTEGKSFEPANTPLHALPGRGTVKLPKQVSTQADKERQTTSSQANENASALLKDRPIVGSSARATAQSKSSAKPPAQGRPKQNLSTRQTRKTKAQSGHEINVPSQLKQEARKLEHPPSKNNHAHKLPAGLVPPPPSNLPAFQMAVPHLDLTPPSKEKTDSTLKSKDKQSPTKNQAEPTKPQAKPEKAVDAKTGPQDADSDFLIEWASVKKKPAK